MATDIKIYDLENKIVGSASLPEELFAVKVSKEILHEVVCAEEAAARLGTAKTKNRGEVRGGGIKPWKQKGTGRARHGSIRSPIWEGGGVVWGPRPRSYAYKVNRKVRKQALIGALTARMSEERIIALDPANLSERATKRVAKFLGNFDGIRRPLLVYAPGENVLADSFRNIEGAERKSWASLSARAVLTSDLLVFTRAAIETIAQDRSGTSRDEVEEKAEAAS